jgi:hypothetical protein
MEVSDAESCFQVQCNQVFIGMVTMQYQALTDMVSDGRFELLEFSPVEHQLFLLTRCN